MLFGALLLWLALQALRVGLQTHGLHSNDTKPVQPLLRHVNKPLLISKCPQDAQRLGCAHAQPLLRA